MNDINQATAAPCPCKRAKKRLWVFIAIALTAALAACIAGAVSAIGSFDEGTRYLSDSIATVALEVLIAVTVAISVSALFVFGSRALTKRKFAYTSPARLLHLLPATASIACIHHTFNPSRLVLADEQMGASIASIVYIIGIFCALYCISCMFSGFNKAWRLVSGMASIVFCLIIIIVLYFDLTVELNSPLKLLVQFATAALAIDLCMELRDTATAVSTGAFIASKVLMISLCSVAFTVLLCAVNSGAELPDNAYLIYSAYTFSYVPAAIYSLFTVKTAKNESISESDVTETPATEAITDVEPTVEVEPAAEIEPAEEVEPTAEVEAIDEAPEDEAIDEAPEDETYEVEAPEEIGGSDVETQQTKGASEQ